jgi:DNA-binding response OmpR family regulator
MIKKNSKELMKVLIVEDDSFLLNIYSNQLEAGGFCVFAAEDGDKGLKMAKKEKPNLILLDILLPGKDGFEVLKELKASKETKNIAVLLLTNLSQKADLEKGLSLGANDYLIKAHFMPSEVVAKIKKVMKIVRGS